MKSLSKLTKMKHPRSPQTVERAMCAAGEEYLTTVPVKVESQIAD